MHIYYPHTSTFSRVSKIWCAFSVEIFKQAGCWPLTEGHSCMRHIFQDKVTFLFFFFFIRSEMSKET